MTQQDCLPPDLRGSSTTITAIAAGLSGAGVYRVEAAGQSFVLKVAAENENAADWHRTLPLQRLAADAGVAPRIVHVDEARRAVLTAFVPDRSLSAYYLDPRTHQAALTQLGRTVRRIHELPLPADACIRDPRQLLGQLRDGFPSDFAIPDFVVTAVQRVRAAELPASQRGLVFGHNDLNPSNLVYDGLRQAVGVPVTTCPAAAAVSFRAPSACLSRARAGLAESSGSAHRRQDSLCY